MGAMIVLSPDDERIARALWVGIKEGPWWVFPRVHPDVLTSQAVFDEIRLDLCRFAVACVREADGAASCATCAGTRTVPEHHATGEPGGYVEWVGCPDCGPGDRGAGAGDGAGDGGGWRAEEVPL